MAICPGPIETFGLAALESLACGTPVVAARTGAVGELQQGRQRAEVAYGSAAAFARRPAPWSSAARRRVAAGRPRSATRGTPRSAHARLPRAGRPAPRELEVRRMNPRSSHATGDHVSAHAAGALRPATAPGAEAVPSTALLGRRCRCRARPRGVRGALPGLVPGGRNVPRRPADRRDRPVSYALVCTDRPAVGAGPTSPSAGSAAPRCAPSPPRRPRTARFVALRLDSLDACAGRARRCPRTCTSTSAPPARRPRRPACCWPTPTCATRHQPARLVRRTRRRVGRRERALASPGLARTSPHAQPHAVCACPARIARLHIVRRLAWNTRLGREADVDHHGGSGPAMTNTDITDYRPGACRRRSCAPRR